MISNNIRQDNIYLSVVIPTFNEEKRIGRTLENILSYFDSFRYPYEIIIVDDGGTDRTSVLVEGFSEKYKQVQLLRNEVNHGKGFSVKVGILASKGQYVLFSDADLSTPIKEV